MENRQTDLKPLWRELLAIYEIYRDICARYGFRFWGAFGTAIGAMRHHGFIPWDDDLDVVMPNEDYEKFLQVAVKELPPHLKMVTAANMGYPSMGIGKIQNIDKTVCQRVEKEMGQELPQGVYIDIFPYCGLPKLKWFEKLYHQMLRVRQYGIEKREYRSFQSKILHLVGSLVMLFPGPRNEKELVEEKRRIVRTLSFDGVEKVGYFNWMLMKFGRTLEGRVGEFEADWFRSTKMLPFENTVIPEPVGIDRWLTCIYGDYMTPPPVDQQVCKHAVEAEAPWKYGPLIEGVV